LSASLLFCIDLWGCPKYHRNPIGRRAGRSRRASSPGGRGGRVYWCALCWPFACDGPEVVVRRAQSSACQHVSREGDGCDCAVVAVERAKRHLAVGIASKVTVSSVTKQRPGGTAPVLGGTRLMPFICSLKPVHRRCTACTPRVHRSCPTRHVNAARGRKC